MVDRAGAMRLRRLVLVGALGGLAGLLVPSVAGAHPLGNFTINQASALRLEPQDIAIDHVVDMAEIPTFQAREDIDRNDDGRPSAPERRRWAVGECRRIARTIDVEVDRTRVPIDSDAAAVSFPPGQAGLPTLRLVCRLHAPVALAGGPHEVRMTNRYRSDRIGWREITAVGDHTTLLGAAPAAVSPSASLTDYPSDRLSSPLDQRSVDFAVRGGGAAAPRPPRVPTVTGSVVRGFDDLTQSLTSSVAARRLTVGLALVALAIAIGLGALHAFAPGHGKTVMAAYLVGERGSVRDGLLIGVTVATTHTLGVLLLGIVLTVSQTFAPEAVYPYLSLASGVCFAGLGLVLLVGALRRRRVRFLGLRGHHHGPGGHVHDHDHEHAHAHDHADSATAAPLSRRRLLTLGFAGGLVPTPTAIVVLLGATAIGRAWFGALLVLAYGIGMAATLVLAGVLLAGARRRFDLRSHTERAWRLAAILPVLTAVVITASGLWLVARAAVAF
jgi:ABC-type nickel/cobalt efflux system permease component RcnA